MNTQIYIRRMTWTAALGMGLLFAGLALGQPMHSVMLSMPAYGEEACTWCGPATARMLMKAYPSGSCTIPQEDIWAEICDRRVEPMWDTDPAGMKGAMNTLCPPSLHWSVFSNSAKESLMHSVAKYMTLYNYGVAVVRDTKPHNGCASHKEHWCAIWGIITDRNPVTYPTVNLKWVCLNDPCVSIGQSALVRFVSGSQWYTEFQAVSKIGSVYNTKFVAVIEPPEVVGRAVAPIMIMTGRVIPPERALTLATQAVQQLKLAEIGPFRPIGNCRPQTPILVNKERGGYYLIPFSGGGAADSVSIALLMNAYTGELQEAGTFKPIRFLKTDEVIKAGREYLKVGETPRAQVERILPEEASGADRYFPQYRLKVDQKTVDLDWNGEVVNP